MKPRFFSCFCKTLWLTRLSSTISTLSLVWSIALTDGNAGGGDNGSVCTGDRFAPVVLDRPRGFPEEFLLLSNVTAESEEFLRKEFMVFAIGVSWVILSTVRAFT